MHELRHPILAVDRFQQRHRLLAFPFATAKKFSDDQAGNLAGLIAYYGFLSLFPLLLVLVSILGRLLPTHPGLQHRVLDSALANFPVVGPELKRNVHALTAHSTTALVIGTVLAVWAGTQVVKATEHALDSVWNVPYRQRPGFLATNARALAMLLVLGAITAASAVTGALGGGSGAWWWTVGGVLLSLLLNWALFLLMFRVLTVTSLSWSDVLPGALVAGTAWTILQALGGLYVRHEIQASTGTYGTFAIVIGLLAWIYLGAQITLFAAELNVVRKERLWPRSITYRPPTAADELQLRRLAKVEERREGQQVHTTLPDETSHTPADRPTDGDVRRSA